MSKFYHLLLSINYLILSLLLESTTTIYHHPHHRGIGIGVSAVYTDNIEIVASTVPVAYGKSLEVILPFHSIISPYHLHAPSMIHFYAISYTNIHHYISNALIFTLYYTLLVLTFIYIYFHMQS
jgi:hypothetical protein